MASWEPVAALFSLLLRPPAPSRKLALDNVSACRPARRWPAACLPTCACLRVQLGQQVQAEAQPCPLALPTCGLCQGIAV